jgi:lycopene cyclase domain-containing protein
LAFVLAAWLFRGLGYTFIAMLSVTVFLSTLAIGAPGLVGTSAFWIWTAIAFVLFVIVDGLYTALPTIFYNPKAMWGLRIGSIPLEDFFYNLSYLGLTLAFYLFYEKWLGLVP